MLSAIKSGFAGGSGVKHRIIARKEGMRLGIQTKVLSMPQEYNRILSHVCMRMLPKLFCYYEKNCVVAMNLR